MAIWVSSQKPAYLLLPKAILNMVNERAGKVEGKAKSLACNSLVLVLVAAFFRLFFYRRWCWQSAPTTPLGKVGDFCQPWPPARW